MKVRVDAELCTGCGVCVDTCPEVFELRDDISVVLVGEVSDVYAEAARDAADSCPTEAITVDED
jgi:ferredoxin